MGTPNPSSVGSPQLNGNSPAPSPFKTKFDSGDVLKPFIKSLLQTTLNGASWDRDRDIMRRYSKGVSDAVKAKMLEIEPTGYKFIVQVQLVESKGQAGRADLSCHWEDSDAVVQEIFANDSLICTVLAYAVRAF